MAMYPTLDARPSFRGPVSASARVIRLWWENRKNAAKNYGRVCLQRAEDGASKLRPARGRAQHGGGEQHHVTWYASYKGFLQQVFSTGRYWFPRPP